MPRVGWCSSLALVALEDFNPALPNEFYAVYSDDGAVYVSTLGGNVVRIGQSTAEDPGAGGQIGTGATTGNTGSGQELEFTTQYIWSQIH